MNMYIIYIMLILIQLAVKDNSIDRVYNSIAEKISWPEGLTCKNTFFLVSLEHEMSLIIIYLIVP